MRTVVLALGVVVAHTAFAIGVAPTRLIFDNVNAPAQSLQIMGDRAADTAVELYVLTRTFERGAVQLVPDDGSCIDLSLPQTLLTSGGSQEVAVQPDPWTPGCRGQSFYLVIETLPITGHAPGESASLRLAPTFFVPLHVAPSAGQKLSYALQNDGHYLRLSNASQASILFSTVHLELRNARTGEWHPLPGASIAAELNSDALLSGEHRLLPIETLAGEGPFNGIRRATERERSGDNI